MTNFETLGKQIRDLCRDLVLEYMHSTAECQPGKKGLRQAEIFRECGLDWGKYPLITSSQQQYWVVAILSDLDKKGKVERISKSGPWRLCK